MDAKGAMAPRSARAAAPPMTYGRAARVSRTFAELRRRQRLRAATRALRWLVRTAAFEAFQRHPLQYLSREEFGQSLAGARFAVLKSRGTFLAGLSLLAWARGRRRMRRR